MGNELIVGTGALAPNRPLKVLVAEDSRPDAELLLAALKRSGVVVADFDVVESPESFRRRLTDTIYDVVLTDHNLITWTGLDALATLQDLGKNIPLIVVTGSLGDEQAVQYIKKGAADYVLKDNLGHLATAIDRSLREKAMRDHAVQLQVQIARGKREWELTFDSVPDPTFVIGEDCRIVRANRAAANVFGLPFEAIVGKYCYEVIHGRTDPLPSCPHQELLQSGETAEGDIEEPRLGKTFHSTTSVLRDPGGAFRGCVHVLHDVTYRKRAEEALRVSEEKFAGIFRSSPDAIALTSLVDGRFLEVNDQFERLTAFTREEALAHNAVELGLWQDQKDLDDLVRLLEQHGRIQDYERQVPNRFGEMRSLVFSGEKVEVAGEPCMVAIVRDVTDRKRIFDTIRRQALALENMHDAVIVVDNDQEIIDWNQAATRIFGYEKSEALGQSPTIINRGRDWRAEFKAMSETVVNTGRWQGEGDFVRKDGVAGVCETVVVPLRDEAGDQIAQVSVSRDVTERKRAERELQESEQKYRELIEHAIYGIFRGTVDGTLLDVNPAFVEMLGYGSKEELLQVNLATGVYEDPAERARVLRGYVNAPGRVRAETNFKRKDGALIKVRLDGREVRRADNQTLYFEVFVEDVTEQKNLEEQFRQAQKMEAVGQLAGGIAHDFNNLLMVINSYAEMITSREIADPAIERYSKQIIQAGKKATSLTSKLLAFSRKQVLQPAVLDLHVVTTDLGNMLPPMLGEDIEMTIVAAPKLGNIYADRAQIEQVVMNLAVNARDAMPQGGKLRIELSNVEIDERYLLRHAQVVPGSYVVLEVSDTGCGMDAATQAKIFEPFFTTKGVGKGTGLGLSTVYGIIKQSGGFIWVYSEPGVGTTFKIYLPRVFERVVTAGDIREDKPDYLGNSETVLLVDDEPALRLAAREFLEGKGYRVLEAENGAGALGVCTAHRGSIQILVTDLIMPGMRGPELAGKISKLYPEIKTVYMSGYADRSHDIEELGRDVVFLQKPFSLNALAQKLHSALHQESPACSG